MRGIQTHATPGKKVKGVFLVPPKGGDKIQLTAEIFGQLQAIKGVCMWSAKGLQGQCRAAHRHCVEG